MTEHGNDGIRQGGIDVRPFLRLLFLTKGVGCQRLINLRRGQLVRWALLRFSESQSVNSDLNFNDFLDAVCLAIFKFRRFHPARCIFDVRMSGAHARAEPLHRSEERRVGKEWVSTCRSRWS